MNVLVTGCTGFLGQRVLHYFKNSDHRLICLVRDIQIAKRMHNSKSVIYIPISAQLSNPIESLVPKLKLYQPLDVCIHMAAETVSNNRELNYQANHVLTKNIIKLCNQLNIKKIIYLSSINTRFRIRGNYSNTKLSGEGLIKKSGLNYIVLLPTLIYGAGDKGLSKTVHMIKKLPIIPVIGSGNAKMQPVYVDDLAKVIVNAVNSKNWNTEYYMGGAQTLTFNQFLHLLMRILKVKKPIIHIPFSLVYPIVRVLSRFTESLPISLEQTASLVQDKHGSIDRATKDLYYAPTSLEENIRNILR